MSSTYSTNLAIELIGTGDQAGTWGNTTNTNLGTLIEQAISGYVTQAVSTGTDTTITIPNGATGVARNMYIELTGTGGTNTNLIVPANKKLYFIFNNASGAVTVKVSGQTGVSVPAGKKVVLASNGTDTVNALNYIADFGSNSATITQLTATSATITNLTLTSLVISNLSIASANITTLTSSSATISTTLALSGGTANGVTYLNGSKVLTSGSALTFDGTTVSSPVVQSTNGTITSVLSYSVGNSTGVIGTTSNHALEFRQNNAEGMRLTSTGLGIGTSSPVGKLDVVGSSSRVRWDLSNAYVYQAATNTAASAFAAAYYDGSQHLWLTSSSTRMTLDSSGNLGLGVTPSAWSTLVPAFQLGGGGAFISGRSTNPEVYVGTNAHFNGSSYIYKTSNVASLYAQDTASHRWYTAPSGTAGNAITFTQAMTLDADGDLGIGTTSPASKLHVKVGTNKNLEVRDASAWDGSYSGVFLDSLNDARSSVVDLVARGSNLTLASAGATPMIFNTNATERARITAAGDLLVGTSTAPTISSTGIFIGGSGNRGVMWSPTSDTHYVKLESSVIDGLTINGFSGVAFATGSRTNSTWAERARIDSSGNFLIGTTSATFKFTLQGSGSGTGVQDGLVAIRCTTAANPVGIAFVNSGNAASSFNDLAFIQAIIESGSAKGALRFITRNSDGSNSDVAERARINSGGDFFVAKTADTLSAVGHALLANGAATHTRSGNGVLFINRLASDGDLVVFYQDTTQEGSISVSGNTVSYNAFAGSHWSQLQDGSKPDILRGTVMESINELCVWPDEQNERLPKSKVSDTVGSKKVYGVFMAWDNDWTTTNDMYVTAVGAFICRVNGSVTVQEGDLLESNGDGTARVQADDIIRSSTIGKVTSTVKTHEYDDGSYCVPTVLYCG